MFSVATMPIFNVGDGLSSAWNQHQPFVSSPLSSSPIRASSPSSPLAEKSANLGHRETQSSPIRQSTFNKFSRYAHQAPTHAAQTRQRQSRARETRRKDFLDQVRQRADQRSYQRRDMEGTLMKSSWDRDMRERELQKQMEGDAFFSEADIDDAAELLFEQEREMTRQANGTGQAAPIHEGANDEMMLDEMVQQEERELDEMLLAYEEPIAQKSATPQRPPSPSFGDDDDFDALFMELVSQEDQGMDMS